MRYENKCLGNWLSEMVEALPNLPGEFAGDVLDLMTERLDENGLGWSDVAACVRHGFQSSLDSQSVDGRPLPLGAFSVAAWCYQRAGRLSPIDQNFVSGMLARLTVDRAMTDEESGRLERVYRGILADISMPMREPWQAID